MLQNGTTTKSSVEGYFVAIAVDLNNLNNDLRKFLNKVNLILEILTWDH